jgi:hypothetical protein
VYSVSKLPRDRAGAVAVELALVLPALLAVLLGIIEMGRLFEAQAAMGHAADKAIRKAVVGASVESVTSSVLLDTACLDGPDATVELEFRRWMYDHWGDWQTVATTEDGNSAPATSQVRVSVDIDHQLLAGGFFARMLGKAPIGSLELHVTRHLSRE